MDRIHTDSKADLIFNLGWKSENVRHMDCYHAGDVNFWRDILPADLRTEINHSRTGDQVVLRFAPGETIPESATCRWNTWSIRLPFLRKRRGC